MDHDDSLLKVANSELEDFETEAIYRFTQQMRKGLVKRAVHMDLTEPKAVTALNGVLNAMSDASFKKDRGSREDKMMDSQQVTAEAAMLLARMLKEGAIPSKTTGAIPEADLGPDGDIQDWELELTPNDEDLPTFNKRMGVEPTSP